MVDPLHPAHRVPKSSIAGVVSDSRTLIIVAVLECINHYGVMVTVTFRGVIAQGTSCICWQPFNNCKRKPTKRP